MSRRWLLALALLVVAAGIAVYEGASHSDAGSAAGAPHTRSSCPWIYVYADAPNELGFDTRYGQCAPVDNKLPFNLHYTWLRCDLAGKHCVPIRSLKGQEVLPPREPKLYAIRGAVTTTNSGGSVTDVSRDFYLVSSGILRKATGLPSDSR